MTRRMNFLRRLVSWDALDDPKWLSMLAGPLMGLTMATTLGFVWLVFWLGLRSW